MRFHFLLSRILACIHFSWILIEWLHPTLRTRSSTSYFGVRTYILQSWGATEADNWPWAENDECCRNKMEYEFWTISLHHLIMVSYCDLKKASIPPIDREQWQQWMKRARCLTIGRWWLPGSPAGSREPQPSCCCWAAQPIPVKAHNTVSFRILLNLYVVLL